MRVAVTGAAGRLGRGLMRALEDAPYTGPSGPIGWTRRDLDLDWPEAIDRQLDADRIEVLVHAAAWTDVDGCARDPELANRRNAQATGRIAAACALRGIDLIVVSTNEVFDGLREDGRGYSVSEMPRPANPYGASKRAGEVAASAAYANGAHGGRLGIVRTAWLFGPPGGDFPTKILEAAARATSTGSPLRVVGDEVGAPTYAADLAEAIAELIGADDVEGVHHLTNAGAVSRAGWARHILSAAGLKVPITEITSAEWGRASTPPRWGVLEPTLLPTGQPMRPWQEAFADYLPVLLRQRAAAGDGR